MAFLQKRVSTHIRDEGFAVFKQSKDPGLQTFSFDNPKVDNKWIRRISSVIEGTARSTYLHREIRLPYGSELTDDDVEQSLVESIGAKREKYGRALWHEFFQEDTSQGTQHRVFISFSNREPSLSSFRDISLPLETAVLALSAKLQEKRGDADFQLILSLKGCIFSMLYIGNSPFHLLRIDSDEVPENIGRLMKHAEFGLSVIPKSKLLRCMFALLFIFPFGKA